MTANPPLVSIITPSFNQGRFLPATLRSVAEQDYPNLEHIVMDGGSTDGSVDVLEAWARSHPLRWTSQPDNGQAAAIQSGLDLANGDVIAWLNSDDVYLDSKVVSDLVAALDAGAEVVTGAGWYLSEAGVRTRSIPVHEDRLDFESLRLVDWILQPATFFRADVLRRFPIDESLVYAFDWDLFIRIAREIAIKPVAREVAGYRLHRDAKTTSGAIRRKREILEVARRYNSSVSPQIFLLWFLVLGYGAATHLPWPLRAGRRIFTEIASLSQRLPGGRGVQF